jgi:hypothetical protein
VKPLFLVCLLFFLALVGCDGWTVRPIPNNLPVTPFPSQTPIIHTDTPVVLRSTLTSTVTVVSLTPTQPTETVTPLAEPSSTATSASSTIIPTLETVPSGLIKVDILGCNTSLDITHGMGEVTNAYLTISNPGTTDLENVCATLRGQDEGRVHPDKTKCIASLPGGYQLTEKLTIDTTYKEVSPIQVDVTSNNALLQRLGKDSCKNIGLFPPDIEDLGVIKRIP